MRLANKYFGPEWSHRTKILILVAWRKFSAFRPLLIFRWNGKPSNARTGSDSTFWAQIRHFELRNLRFDISGPDSAFRAQVRDFRHPWLEFIIIEIIKKLARQYPYPREQKNKHSGLWKHASNGILRAAKILQKNIKLMTSQPIGRFLIDKSRFRSENVESALEMSNLSPRCRIWARNVESELKMSNLSSRCRIWARDVESELEMSNLSSKCRIRAQNVESEPEMPNLSSISVCPARSAFFPTTHTMPTHRPMREKKFRKKKTRAGIFHKIPAATRKMTLRHGMWIPHKTVLFCTESTFRVKNKNSRRANEKQIFGFFFFGLFRVAQCSEF